MAHTFPKFGYDPVSGEWNDSLKGEFLWSNLNTNEGVPDVMTPSTWSLSWIIICEVNPIDFPGNLALGGNICGRPYMNISLMASVYHALMPNAPLQNDLFFGSVPAGIRMPLLPLSRFEVGRTILPGLLKTFWLIYHSQRNLAQFLNTTPGWCRATRNEMMNWKDPQSLLLGWREKIRPAIVRACQIVYTITISQSFPATQLRDELNTLVGAAEANALLSNLSGDSGDLASLGLLLGMARVQAGRLTRAEYIEQYGHRGPHEHELSAPGSDDDPAWFEKQLEQFNRTGVDVEALLARQRAEFAAAWQRFAARFPDKAKATRRKLDKVSLAAKNREAARSEWVRVVRLIRRFLLCVAEVTGLGDDIFFLTVDEIAEMLAGDRSSIPYIPARKESYLKYCALPPYPLFIVGSFDPSQWAADPNRRSDYFDAQQGKVAVAHSDVIRGFAGAAGVVEGIVRRLDTPEDGWQLQPGEILVTATTNVGWTPLFPHLAAIVTDIGAPLSHAAIVARELGIPAVVGCNNATMHLKTGDRVRVDGGAGTVELKR